jgi:hypothetical protein
MDQIMSELAYRTTSSRRVYRRWEGDCNDLQFLELMQELRGHGGMLPVEEVLAVSYVCSPGSSISQHLMQNMLFFVIWRRQHWMPCFQFSSSTWQPCPVISLLVQELRPAMGGADLAMWFTHKDRVLGGHSPLDLIHSDFERVRQFARQARFSYSG